MGTENQKQHHHHILPVSTIFKIGTLLLIMTAVTVWVAGVDLGHFNFAIAMAVATFKALLVALFFMNLKYDHYENGMIFFTSFLFLLIFMVLTSTDLFFRGDVYVKGPLIVEAQTKSKLSKPWISTPQLIAHGKELFAVQCVSCHGVEGKGDGPAASALNPHPRNFTSPEGWKNGRRPTMVFKTLKEGLPPSAMASYATLSSDDRWALTHYVMTMAPNPEKDAPADFAKIGINPAQEGGGEKEAPTISIDLAMSQLTQVGRKNDSEAVLYSPMERVEERTSSPGKRLYQRNCEECHGQDGRGGIKVATLGVRPVAFVTTEPFLKSSEGLKSVEIFKGLIHRGLPGNLMPGFGHFSSSEVQDLYQAVTGFAK